MARAMTMDEKMKSCFTGHVMMHSLIGLGLGILLVSFMPGLANLWLGLVLIIIGVGLDFMRK